MSAELELIARLKDEASRAVTGLTGNLKGMGVSAERSSLQLAAVKQQSQLLETKTNELARAVAKGEKSFDQAERELEDYRRTLARLPDVAEKSSRSFGAMDVALGNLAAEGLQRAVAAIGEFIGGSIDLASNAAETTSLLENSLGPAAVGFSEDIDRMAEATNRSSIELEQGSSTIVAMTKSMGFGQEAAANFSVSMAQIATDLGSFFNQSTEQVFQDIQSALAGSAETMLKYGIDVKETALQQAALRMGLVDSLGPLDRVTRATVLQAEIQRQAADAMGDAELTADSFGNTQRGLEAATLDLQAAIGEELIPVMYELAVASTEAVRGLSGILSANRQSRELEELAFNYKEIRKAVDDTAVEMGGFLDVFESNRIAAKLYTEVIKLLEAGIEGTGEELVAFAQAAIAADMRAEAMNREFKNSVAVNEDLAEAIEETTRLTVEQSRAIVNATQENHTYEVSAEQVEEAERRRAEAHEAAAAAADTTAAALSAAQVAAGNYFQEILEGSDVARDLNDIIFDQAVEAGKTVEELEEMAVAIFGYTEAQAAAAVAGAALRIEQDKLIVTFGTGALTADQMRLAMDLLEQGLADTSEEARFMAQTALPNTTQSLGLMEAAALLAKDGVLGLTEGVVGYADGSPYEAVMVADTEAAGQEIDILKGKTDSTAGTYNIHFSVTSDPFPQPEGGGATGGGTGDLPAPDFQHGGFTGHGTGFAGRVHHNEFVFNPEATRNIGVGLLERLHDAARGGPGIGGPGPPLFFDSAPGADTIAGASAGAGGNFIFSPTIHVSGGGDVGRIRQVVQQELAAAGRQAESLWRMRR